MNMYVDSFHKLRMSIIIIIIHLYMMHVFE